MEMNGAAADPGVGKGRPSVSKFARHNQGPFKVLLTGPISMRAPKTEEPHCAMGIFPLIACSSREFSKGNPRDGFQEGKPAVFTFLSVCYNLSRYAEAGMGRRCLDFESHGPPVPGCIVPPFRDVAFAWSVRTTLVKLGHGPRSGVLDELARVSYRGSFDHEETDFEVRNTSGTTMTKSEIQAFRDQLTALRDRHNGDASHLADEALRRTGGGAAGNLSNMPIHMADLGTDNFEQEFTLNLLQNEEQLLDEITAALERMNQGKFGLCEECQNPIPKARLQAVPYARYCVDCARKLEERK
jgi:DnaK suppressor protein